LQIKISRGVVSQGNGFASKFVMADKKMDNKIPMVTKKEGFLHKNHVDDVESKRQLLKQQMLFNQQRDIQELKHTIHTTKASMQFLQMKFHEEFSNLVLEENRKLYNQVQDLKGKFLIGWLL
ncbi:Kinesin-like protein KIN-14I, partial [Glycine soja]